MLTAEELYFKLQELKKTGRNLKEIFVEVESSETDVTFSLMANTISLNYENNLCITFYDEEEQL